MFLHFAVGFWVSLERFWHWRRKGLVVSAVSLQEKQFAIKAQIHKNVKNALKKSFKKLVWLSNKKNMIFAVILQTIKTQDIF